jgi:hypothetical protein
MRKIGSALILAFTLAVATAPAAMAHEEAQPTRLERKAARVGTVIQRLDNAADRLGDKISALETRLAAPDLGPRQEARLEAKQARLAETQSVVQQAHDLLLQWACDPNGVLLPFFMAQCGWE